MNTLNKITTRSRWSYAWSVLRVVEAGRIPCVSIQLTLSQLTRRKNVSGPHVPRCTVRHRPRATERTRRTQRPSPTPFESFGRRARVERRPSGRSLPRILRSLSARAGSLRRVGVVPMTMPLSDFVPPVHRTCRARSIYGTNPDPRPHSTCTILSDISLRSPAARALTGRAVTTFT